MTTTLLNSYYALRRDVICMRTTHKTLDFMKNFLLSFTWRKKRVWAQSTSKYDTFHISFSSAITLRT